jgi:branched-chain amino acid transport system ATP-binding protein
MIVIGPNGSGKSTLLRVLAGYLRPSKGICEMGGRDLSSLAPHERVNLGLGYFMQSGRVFQSLTVAENLDISRRTGKGDEPKESLNIVLDLFPNLKGMLTKEAGLLSGGERQALALAMVLLKRPQMLLLDEPSAGLAPRVVQDLLEKISDLRKTWHMTVILVEQNVNEGLKVADRAVALVNGRVVLETSQPRDWLVNSQLEAIFLGQNLEISSAKDGGGR